MFNLMKIFSKKKEERISTELQGICCAIGHFYLRKCENNYEEAADEIARLRVTEVSLVSDEVHIRLNRPGILIGRRGENIGNLEKFLKRKVKIFEETTDWTYLLTPIDYEKELDDLY